MQAPYIPVRHIPLPKIVPTASYNPQRKVVAVANGYPVREVLKAAGYYWYPSDRSWRRDCSTEDFRADWELLSSLGVDLDAATAMLLAAPIQTPEPVQPAPVAVKASVEDDNDALFGPPIVDYPIKSTPKPAAAAKAAPAAPKPAFDASSLTRARERILRLAASGRIKDQKDLEELRSIAGLIRQAIEVA